MFCCLAYNGTVVAGDSASSHLRLSPAHVKKIKCYLICGKATATRTILYTARHVSGLRARFCSSPSPNYAGSPKMLAFVAALTILLLISGSAVAQIGAPGCFTAPWGWVWLFLILLFFAFVKAERLL
jgi:hypothetical protein